MTRPAAAAAQSVAAGQGLEAAEQVIRAGLLRLGAGMLEDLLAIDAGYAGPRIGWTTRPLAASRRLNRVHQPALLGVRVRGPEVSREPRRLPVHCLRLHLQR